MSNESFLKVSRPFGPPLGKVSIPDTLIKNINDFVDNEIVNNNNRSKELDAGSDLVGQVTQEINMPKEILDNGLHNFLEQTTIGYIKLSINKDVTKFKLLNSWVVRQFETEYNPLHFHSGHISGAGYLMIPESLGSTVQDQKKVNTHGNINFHHGSKHFMSSGYVSNKPKVGDFYIFPHYLYHSVNPFFGKGERRSLSFNAKVNEEIFQVYGDHVYSEKK